MVKEVNDKNNPRMKGTMNTTVNIINSGKRNIGKYLTIYFLIIITPF